MMPPAPTRMVVVPAARCAITSDVAAVVDRRHVVVLGHPDAAEPQRLDVTCHLARLVEGIPAGAALANAAELEDRERNHSREAA